MNRGACVALCAIASIGAARVVPAQAVANPKWTLTGSYLNLYTRSRTVVPPAERFGLDLSRFRLKLDAKPLSSVGIEVQYDNELLLGNYIGTTQYAATSARVETSFDLQREYATRSDLVARHALYRAIVSWSGTSTDVRIGRQRIALGTGFFWSPMDLLNPIDPTRLERDYRAGADAVLVEQQLGAIGRVSGMYSPATGRMKAMGAGYLHGNLRGTDYSVLVGSFHGDLVLGTDFSGSVGGLGLRGELTTTRPDSGSRYARALFGADYGFENSVKLTVETSYNGRGTSDPTRYDVNAVIAGGALNLARWYAGAALTYDVTPLVKASGYAVVNADDGSTVLWPQLEWSARPDLDLTIGVQHFAGGTRSEYGRAHTLLHGGVKWFF